MKKIMIMAGGTGGHIMPGLAVAQEMKRRGWEVVWLGNQAHMEGRLVPEYGFPLVSLNFNGVRGKGLMSWVKLPFRLIRALFQSRAILLRERPDIVLGMGGYISFPAGIMATMSKIPLLIHEQNAIPGSANQQLAIRATKVLTAFPAVLPNGICVGNPVRKVMTEAAPPHKRYSKRTGPLHVLVVGGSLGAKILNDVVPQALALIDPEQRPVVMHQSGIQHIDELRQNYENVGVKALCVPFIEDMKKALSEADIVICRAGAMTVAEVAAVGVAALFIPLPTAIDDHQTKNAHFLVDQQAADMLPQSDFTADTLAQYLRDCQRETLEQKATQARALGRPKSASEIADICETCDRERNAT